MIEFKNEELNDKFNELLVLLNLNNIDYKLTPYNNTLNFVINNHLVAIMFININNCINEIIVGNIIKFNKNDTIKDKMYKIIDYCINKYILKVGELQ